MIWSVLDKKDFASRVAYLAEVLMPNVKNKEKRLSEITGEKASTVRNWLFNGKMPVNKNRIIISDKMGVSEEYLFYGGQKSYPLAKYDLESDSYSVPVITEEDILKIADNVKNIIVVRSRKIVSLEESLLTSIKEIEKTFCINVEYISFHPFISKGDSLLINTTAKIKNGIFAILITKGDIKIVTINDTDDELFFHDENGIINRIRDSDIIMPILMTISTRYR
jgi:phage repressor protein C with HTH and peptisase S24 domain